MKRKADQIEVWSIKKSKIDYEAKTNLFSLLPDEILREILSYLNEHDLRWTRLIDSRLIKLIDIRHFDIGVILASEMSEVTRVFGRYDKPIGLTFRKADKINSDFNVLSQLTQLTSLDIGSKTIDVVKLTNLQSLTATVEPFNLQHHSRLTLWKTAYFQTLQPHMYPAHLEQLSIEDLAKPALANEAKFKAEYEKCLEAMPNITKLRVAEKSSPYLIAGIRCHLTGLEYLDTCASITGLPVNTMTELDILSSLFDFNWSFSHLTNLRRLNMQSSRFINKTSLLPFTLLESLILGRVESAFKADAHLTQLNGSNITQLDVTLSEQNSLERVMTFTNLQNLCLSLEYPNVDIDRLSQLTRLTMLVVSCNTVQNIGECTKLKNLMELVIHPRIPSEDLVVVSSLTRLTRLGMRHVTSDLSNMTKLQDLQVLKPVIGLSTLHNLTRLFCSSHSLTQELCTTLTALQYLIRWLGMSCPIKPLEAVATLTRLTYLHGRTSGSGACLTRLTRLQDFFIHANEGSKKIAKDLHEKFIFCGEDFAFKYIYPDRNEETSGNENE